MISHDQNFKNLILDYPREALAFFAPEEAEDLDDSVSIQPLRQEQLKSRLGDRFRELDVPLLVEWADGRREALLFVLEEETDPGRFSIHRLVNYCSDLSDLYDTDRVVPVVIFLKGGNRVCKRLQLGSERHTYLDFNYLSCELSQTNAENYWHSHNLVARLNLPNMRWSPGQKVAVYAQAIRGLLQLEPDIERQLKYIDFIDIYSALDDNEMTSYQEQYPRETQVMTGLRARLLAEGREEGMEKGLEKGLEKGMEKGMEKGRQEGLRELFTRLLAARFGSPDDATLARVNRASAEELTQWTEKLMDSRSLDEVFRTS